MKKKILFSLLIIIIVVSAVLIYIDWSLTPLTEEKRNTSSTDVKMLVDFQDADKRSPIIRTYRQDEFDDFDKNKINKIKNIVNGNIEGDIPALQLENGIGRLAISFEKINKDKDLSEVNRLIADELPKIKIILYSKKK